VSAVTNAITFNATGYNINTGGSPFFQNGRVTWLTGDNAGYTQQIASQEVLLGPVLALTLRTQPGADIDMGDTFTATAGCDRTATDCQFKFRNTAQPNGNLVNYRGFPGLIGTDIYLTAAKIKAIDDAGGRTPF
jgi:uncharacterized phage protein (TIGR02218 family)